MKFTKLKNGGEVRYFCGIERYYNKDGQLHREDGPAVVYPLYADVWYLHNERTTSFNVFLAALNKSLSLTEFYK